MQRLVPTERAENGTRKTSQIKLASKVDRLLFIQKIKDKMILDGRNTSSGLGKPQKAQLDNKREEQVYTVNLTYDAQSEFYRAVSDGHINFKDADHLMVLHRLNFKDSHIKLLERAVGSLASEKLRGSLFNCFSANLTKEEANKVSGMDEVQAVSPSGQIVLC